MPLMASSCYVVDRSLEIGGMFVEKHESFSVLSFFIIARLTNPAPTGGMSGGKATYEHCFLSMSSKHSYGRCPVIKAPTVGIFERKRARRTQEAQMNEVLLSDDVVCTQCSHTT